MKNLKPILGIILAVFSGPGTSVGSSSPVAASWLGIPTSARQAALSGALGALTGDIDALGTNPAGLASLSGIQISALHNLWAQSLTAEHLAIGQGFGNYGLALGGDFVNFGTVQLYNVGSSGPLANGTFNPTGLNLYGGAGLELPGGVALGADAKFIQDNLQSNVSNSALAADLGLRYHPSPKGPSIGAALLNLGTQLLGTTLPTCLDLSGAYGFDLAQNHSLNLALDGKWSLEDSNGSTASLAGEYWYRDTLALRAGYRLAGYGTLQGLAGLSAGVGVKLRDLDLSYALTTLGDMGTGHQISLSYRFDVLEQAPSLIPSALTFELEGEKAKVQWKEAAPDKVAGYNCYVKRPGAESFKKITDKPINKPTYTFKHLKKKGEYVLGVTTVDKDGKESEMAQVKVSTEPTEKK